MTSEGLWEVFKCDSADKCAGKFPLVSMGGRANRQACADGERIGASGIFFYCFRSTFTKFDLVFASSFVIWVRNTGICLVFLPNK
jgi:hypothetical protein